MGGYSRNQEGVGVKKSTLFAVLLTRFKKSKTYGWGSPPTLPLWLRGGCPPPPPMAMAMYGPHGHGHVWLYY
jgi:hypothetical protein